MPKRIQRRRTKGFKLPPNTACVSRPSKFGNPYRVGIETEDHIGFTVHPKTIQECLDLYRADLEWHIRMTDIHMHDDFLKELRGVDYIACFCKEDAPCHGDVLIEFLKLAP